MYSKGAGQNTTASQTATARYDLYIADLINWPTPSAEDQAITQGEFYKRRNSQMRALMYFHCCLFSDTEYTVEQFTIGSARYYIDPRWYLTYSGSTLTSDTTDSDTQLQVADLAPFRMGDRVMLGGVAGQSRVELAKVTAKSAASGPGQLQVSRGVLSQDGRFAATAHSAGEYVRPVAHAFGSSQWMVLNPTSSGVRSDVNRDLGLQTWSEFLASFLAHKLDDPAFDNVDGFMLDNLVDRASAFVDDPQRVDLSNSNTATGVPDAVWSESMRDLVATVRAKLPANRILTANSGGDQMQTFGAYLGGGMLEGIDGTGHTELSGGLDSSLAFYWNWMQHARQPTTFVFDGSPRASSLDAGAMDYQAMRFLLTLALTDDGYFAFDEFNINEGHQTLWWYDEYDNAGQGTGYLGNSLGPRFEPVSGVYRRDFTGGISLSNTTGSTQTIPLGGTFRKIKGAQAPAINDGSLVSSVTLAADDGIILLRT